MRRSNSCKFEGFNLGQLVDIFIFYIWMMDVWTLNIDKNTYVCNWFYICGRIWVSEIGVHMLTLEALTIHWQDDEWLSQWARVPSTRHVWFKVLPKLLKMTDSYNGHHPRARKTLFPRSNLVTFYELQSIVLFWIEQNWIGLAPEVDGPDSIYDFGQTPIFEWWQIHPYMTRLHSDNSFFKNSL